MTIDHESPERQPQVVSRLGLYLPPALLLTLALAWCGYWYYSANLAGQVLDKIRAAEAAKGRSWTCADQKIAGFPFRIELHCASISFEATPDGRPMRIRTGPLHAATQIYAPTLVLADVDGPLMMEVDGASTSATWENLRVSVRFSNQLERLSLAMTGPVVEVKSPTGELFASDAKSAEFHLRYDPARPIEDRAVDLALQLTQMSSPALNGLIGTPEKVDLGVSGVATKLADLPPQGWRSLLESWRNQGGNFVIESGKFAKGSVLVDAKGAINLDPSRRLQGKLDVSAIGIGPLLARFGLGGGGVTQLLGSLLTRKDGTPVQWPMQMQDGRVQLGPFRTGQVLAPLY
ncbi:MAG: hypothetical protein JWN07_3331 [Hyphomicrobiales bacterium]|nr:hypothetical protein [Hyphomicrobiales bacterium]